MTSTNDLHRDLCQGAPVMFQAAVLPSALVPSSAASGSRRAARAPADPIESGGIARSLRCRIFATRTGIRFAGRCSIAATLAWLIFSGGAEAAPPDPTGLWSTKDAESVIEIAPCGQFYCGVLVWLEEPNDQAGKPKTDKANENESLRDRPLLGLQLLIDLAPEKSHWHGKAYNPDDGKTYDISFKPAPGKAEGDKAEIRGCVLKIFCQSETFTRVLSLPNAAAAPVAPAPDKPKPTSKPSSSRP